MENSNFDPNVALSLSKEDMLNMRMNGLSPFNPSDVARYRSGKGLSESEKQARAKKLFENANSMGGAYEQDIDVMDKVGSTFNVHELNQITTPKAATPQDYRQALNEEMNSYRGTAGKTFTTDDLMSFSRKPQAPQQPMSNNIEQIKLEGFNLSKQYLNSFVINLQTPNAQNRINLFKNLKLCLEGEVKYKQQPQALHAYREGVQQAEQAMLQKLQG